MVNGVAVYRLDERNNKNIIEKDTYVRNKRWRNYRPEDDETSKDVFAKMPALRVLKRISWACLFKFIS